MTEIRNKLFSLVWFGLIILLLAVSLRYKDRSKALVAVVESEITAVSYQKAVTVLDIKVISGQEVDKGDTLVVVARQSLTLDMAKKRNELEEKLAEKAMAIEGHKNKIELLAIERAGKENNLLAKKNELETRLYQDQIIRRELQQTTKKNNGDSLSRIELKAILAEINGLKGYYIKETERQKLLVRQDTTRINQAMSILGQEIDALEKEQENLIKVAQFSGIIGTVEVQLDELVPPYKTMITIYELQPSIIKAFKNEMAGSPVSPGDSVKIVSENRSYSILGLVRELGARIAPYPNKVQPQNGDMRQYGQEIFISIPKNNRFLNGEKVFVYPNYKEEI